jgi:hypothetical protein
LKNLRGAIFAIKTAYFFKNCTLNLFVKEEHLMIKPTALLVV